MTTSYDAWKLATPDENELDEEEREESDAPDDLRDRCIDPAHCVNPHLDHTREECCFADPDEEPNTEDNP